MPLSGMWWTSRCAPHKGPAYNKIKINTWDETACSLIKDTVLPPWSRITTRIFSSKPAVCHRKGHCGPEWTKKKTEALGPRAEAAHER